MISEQLHERYGKILKVQSKEEAEEVLSALIDDMVSWKCWCVTPSRSEVDRIERKSCIAYVFQSVGLAEAHVISLYLGVKDLSFLPENAENAYDVFQ